MCCCCWLLERPTFKNYTIASIRDTNHQMLVKTNNQLFSELKSMEITEIKKKKIVWFEKDDGVHKKKKSDSLIWIGRGTRVTYLGTHHPTLKPDWGYIHLKIQKFKKEMVCQRSEKGEAHQSRDERNIKKRRKMVLGKIQFSSFQHEKLWCWTDTTSMKSHLPMKYFHLSHSKDH